MLRINAIDPRFLSRHQDTRVRDDRDGSRDRSSTMQKCRAVRRRLTTARCIVAYVIGCGPAQQRGCFVTGPVRRVETIGALPVYEGL